MDREDITRMAREAGFVGFDGENKCLREFAALIAAAEREKVAAWMIQRSYATGHGDTTEDLLKELDWQIDERIAAEREACETIADAEASSWGGFDSGFTASVNIAAAIRARGNK